MALTRVEAVQSELKQRLDAPPSIHDEASLRALAELSPSALIGGRPDGTVTLANAPVEQLLGWKPEELIGKHVKVVWPRRFRREYLDLLCAIRDERPSTGPAREGEFLLARKDGSEVTVRVAARWIDTDRGPISLCALTDLTERDRVEQLLRSLAERDPLTGLFNRRRFEEELGSQVARAVRYGEGGALIALDLDGFKVVNDTLGHQVGDALLQAVAVRLRSRLRESDALVRLGGDEFAALLPHVSGPEALRVAEDLVETLRAEPFALEGGQFQITASAGVSAVGGRRSAAETLLREADLAMYDAKAEGGDRVVAFTDAARARLRARRSCADRVRRALVDEGFELHAQPIVDLSTGTCARVELLLRLRDADGRLTMPDEFMPIAERFDLMRAVDRWVLGQAIELMDGAAKSLAAPHPHVNLSAASVGDLQLPGYVRDLCEQRGVDPRRLTIEISETAAIADLEAARALASALHDAGAEVILDAFGRGFSSFYYLKRLPVDGIKIDGDFVRRVASDETDRLVVRSMVTMAAGLGLRTFAAHVSGTRAVALLREYGVDHAQGHHLGRPRPLIGLAPALSAVR